MLQIDDLVFNAWGRRFFDHASVLLPSNAKVGLVGRNGVGKSTLFKLIQGGLAPDQGEFLPPRGARIASVDQEHPATPVSLLDTILAADEQRDALHAELETAEDEPIILLQKVEHESRVHLDIETDDLEAEAQRLEALGATRIAFVRERWWVMQAPTGHRFCVVRRQREAFGPHLNRWPD